MPNTIEQRKHYGNSEAVSINQLRNRSDQIIGQDVSSTKMSVDIADQVLGGC